MKRYGVRNYTVLLLFAPILFVVLTMADQRVSHAEEIQTPPTADKQAELALHETLIGAIDLTKYHDINLVVSPDIRRLAFRESTDTQSIVIIDGIALPPFDQVDIPKFSNDSKNYLFEAHRGNKAFIVLNGNEGPAYDHIYGLTFSPDFQHVVYLAERAGKQYLVTDGKEHESEYDRLIYLTLSPDGRRIAFVAVRNNVSFMVIDGKKQPDFIQNSVSQPIFSPDGMHIVYQAARGRGHGETEGFVILDGRELPGAMDTSLMPTMCSISSAFG